MVSENDVTHGMNDVLNDFQEGGDVAKEFIDKFEQGTLIIDNRLSFRKLLSTSHGVKYNF